VFTIRSVAFYFDALAAAIPAFKTRESHSMSVGPIVAAFVPTLRSFFGLICGLFRVVYLGAQLTRCWDGTPNPWSIQWISPIWLSWNHTSEGLTRLLSRRHRWHDWSVFGREGRGGRASAMKVLMLQLSAVHICTFSVICSL
jgi:hypothetical protein